MARNNHASLWMVPRCLQEGEGNILETSGRSRCRHFHVLWHFSFLLQRGGEYDQEWMQLQYGLVWAGEWWVGK